MTDGHTEVLTYEGPTAERREILERLGTDDREELRFEMNLGLAHEPRMVDIKQALHPRLPPRR